MGRKVIEIAKRKYIASPQIYRLWFGFYQLALKSKDKEVISALKKSKNFYSSWGTDSVIHLMTGGRRSSIFFMKLKKLS